MNTLSFALSALLGLLIQATFSLGSYLSLAELTRRNPCDGVNAEPILYHSYGEADCPANFHVQPDGTCSGWASETNDCVSFCQQTTNFYRGTESPYPRSECYYPAECSLNDSHSTTWGWGGSAGPKYGKALKTGISGGYSQSWSTFYGQSWSFKPAEHECGYFAFVPVVKETCGVLTESTVFYDDDNQRACTPYPTTTTNYCRRQTWNRDGQPEGVYIFVKIHCITRDTMPMEQQGLIYQLPGVPLDRGTRDYQLSLLTNDTCDWWETTTPAGRQYAFEITGTNFTRSIIGADGGLLQQNITSCNGSLPSGCNWNFQWTSSNAWNATGCFNWNGDPDCIGDAVLAVGGNSAGSCVGIP